MSATLNYDRSSVPAADKFTNLVHQVRAKERIGILRPLLPSKYSPLRPTGDRLQGIYLTEVSPALAEVLSGLIGPEAQMVTAGATVAAAPQQHQQPTGDDLDYWEHTLEQEVVNILEVLDRPRFVPMIAVKARIRSMLASVGISELM